MQVENCEQTIAHINTQHQQLRILVPSRINSDNLGRYLMICLPESKAESKDEFFFFCSEETKLMRPPPATSTA